MGRMAQMTGLEAVLQISQHDMAKGLRADARANRAKILEVARKAFAHDPETSLNGIAKAAGIGPGTLYRHFPSREALVLEIYRAEIAEFGATADQLLQDHPPYEAFRRWCLGLAAFGRQRQGLALALMDSMSSAELCSFFAPMTMAVEAMLQEGERAGVIQPSIRGDDVMHMMGCLFRIPPDEDAEARAERLVDVILRGLSTAELPASRTA